MEFLDPLLLARWQFGLTTLYHYLFVPLTLGMSLVVAIFQTVWYRTADVKWLHLTRFFGKIFLINFAMGVVTGIVQEFQFGMNWSAYSRFVGDVFGAPLAFEGLLAFFLEATFIGLWIFGWDRLPRLAHLATIWMVVIGSTLSAYFILAANAFMQNPVGFQMSADGTRAELVDFWALLTNRVALAAFPHTITSAWMFAAAVVIAVAAWHLARGRNTETMRPALRFGMWFMIVSFVGVALSGDQLGLQMVATQPMKMAAAEAMYNTSCGADASFSLSFLSTHSFDGCVEGINDLQTLYTQQFGPGDYTPIIWVTYWAFRWMMALGGAAAALSVAGLWITRKNSRIAMRPWMWRVLVWSAPLPLLGSLVGWVFTEMGRQPWMVFGLMLTADGVSPSVPAWNVLLSLVAFTAIYATLAIVEVGLLIRYAQKGPDPLPDPDAAAEPDSVENTPTTVY
jgi:cytochrome d ubiquinol oxidase subunit I